MKKILHIGNSEIVKRSTVPDSFNSQFEVIEMPNGRTAAEYAEAVR